MIGAGARWGILPCAHSATISSGRQPHLGTGFPALNALADNSSQSRISSFLLRQRLSKPLDLSGSGEVVL